MVSGNQTVTEWISTKDAMRMLGVGSTTIKRWADEGSLPSTRTAGGHRRFRRDAVERLHRQQPATGKNSEADEWIDLLTEESDVFRIRDRIMKLHDQSSDWYGAADHLNNVMMKIWADRTHDDESNARSHVVAGRLGLALSAISKSLAVEPAAPIVLMATFGGLQHSHRLALTEICVRSEGMEMLRAQQNTSAEELVAQLQSWDQHLVVLAATEQCNDCDLLTSAYSAVSTACQEQGVKLAIGFGFNLPRAISYGHQCQSFEDLRNVVHALKRDTDTAKDN